MSRIDVVPPKDYATRIDIVRAIVEIGRVKGVDAVSVKDVCAAAGMARQTFYRHFSDKLDALAWYCQVDFRESVLQVGTRYTWREAVVRLLESVWDEADFYTTAFRFYRDVSPLEHVTAQMTLAQWRRTVTQIEPAALTPALDFQLRAWSKLAPNLGTEWITTMATGSSAPAAARMFVRCIPPDVRELMDDAALARRA